MKGTGGTTPHFPHGDPGAETRMQLEAENAELRRRVAALERSAAATSSKEIGVDVESGGQVVAAARGAFWPELGGRVMWLVRLYRHYI